MVEMLACGDLESLIDSDNFIPILAITGGLGLGLILGGGAMVAGIFQTRAREMTKREIAAYVAEGSIDPDQAIAMLNAGGSKWCKTEI